MLSWIPLLPLVAAAVHGLVLGLFRRRLSRAVTLGLSCGSVGLSFVLSFTALLELTRLPAEARVLRDGLFTWVGAGSFSAEAAFLLDPLSSVMTLVVTGVGLAVHVYSAGYMADDGREDGGFQRFFAYLNLFIFSMLVLVLADNPLLLFLGWEGVGLCSYLLIGFWYADDAHARAGAKAFIVNRVGDLGFLFGLLLLFWSLAEAGRAAVSFEDLRLAFPAIADRSVEAPAWLLGLLGGSWRLSSLIGLCFLLAAAGKSAQLPLSVWLPDAMAGPTPVSALIHAATMVTAGVYLVCRLSFLYVGAPGASATMAWVGAATALFGATVAVAQTDIKKVLAYSTVSQLGFMFLALGCGAYAAALFHVVTHAFFKALLFLGAGSVILALHHEQDTDRMGGLASPLPWTHATFLVGVLAIVGFPFFSGFFSKDAILLAVYLADLPGHESLQLVALASSGLTAFYMFRLYYRVFRGEYRGPREGARPIHEPGWVILGPLVVLAFLAFAGGWLGPSAALNPFPVDDAHSDSLANFLAPSLAGSFRSSPGAPAERGLAALGAAVALAGFALAHLLYRARPAWPGRLRAATPTLHRLVANGFHLDPLYRATLVRPLVVFSRRVLFAWVDRRLIDGLLVHGTARALRGLSDHALKYTQSGLVQGYLFVVVGGAAALVGFVLW